MVPTIETILVDKCLPTTSARLLPYCVSVINCSPLYLCRLAVYSTAFDKGRRSSRRPGRLDKPSGSDLTHMRA
uniref:Uncharacterized protein n=1 Tax=Ascaris lumbricoides TaxID=6252 RepID=A0A0M3I2G6_ASCLU